MNEDCLALSEAINIDLEDFLTHLHPIITYYGRKKNTCQGPHDHLLEVYTKVQEYKDKITQLCSVHPSPSLQCLRAYHQYLDDGHTQLLTLQLDICDLLTSANHLIQSTWPDDLVVIPIILSFMVNLDDRLEDFLYTNMDKCQAWINHLTKPSERAEATPGGGTRSGSAAGGLHWSPMESTS